ncbi:MAG: phosphotransferase, partial [Myxococcales bacterium]
MPLAGVVLPAWDYGAELARSAADTIEVVERARAEPLLAFARGALRALRRIGGGIVDVQRHLGALPLALIHGDLHSGNVVVRSGRRGAGGPGVAFIDWQRARIGSPLEDVSSFLQSLAYWEPQVRSKHDTLLGQYLAARGMDPSPSRSVRDAYWLAGATNALA